MKIFWKRFWHLIGKLKPYIYLLAFILSVLGSFQVYHGQFSTLGKEISVIAISVIKLFTFFPTVGFVTEAPLAYEIAIWLAPLGTVLGFFSIFKKFLYKFQRAIRTMGRSKTLILGWNDISRQYIQNMKEASPDKVVVVMVDQDQVQDFEGDDEIFLQLGIHLVTFNFYEPLSWINESNWREHGLKKVSQIISFVEEPVNYSQLESLHQLLLKNKQIVEVFVHSQSHRVKDIVQSSLSSLENMNIHFFDLEELMAGQILLDSEFALSLIPGLNRSWKGKSFASIEEICQEMGQVHLLLIGTGGNILPILRQVANMLTVQPMKPIKLTILGPAANQIVEQLRNFIAEIDKVFTLDAIDQAYDTHSMLQDVQFHESQTSQYTGMIINLEEIQQSLLVLDRLYPVYSHLSVACRSKDQNQKGLIYRSIDDRYHKIVFYGNRQKVLMESNIVDQVYYQKAKRFNASYNNTVAEYMGWDPTDESIEAAWFSLSSYKKESSYYQALHQNIKKAILSKFIELDALPNREEELLRQWSERLSGLTVKEQVDIIEQDPMMNFMTALEHERWNHFHFMRHYVYHPEKDISKRQHDCLIEDWTDFLQSSQRDKAIYDFLSVLDLMNDSF